MTYDLLCLGLAGAALFGLGLSIAWLFPAPADSQWVFRIAIAPLMVIAVTTPFALVLDLLGVPLHPMQLVALALVCASAAVRLNRGAVRGAMAASAPPVSVVPGSSGWALPAGIVGLAGFSWYLSMRSFGLYLPNRDFKNHAAFVAQIAWNRSADPGLALRASSVVEPVNASYPLGLHTLLGWVAPSADFDTLGLTAAATVVGCAISLPLGLIALGRMWDGQSRSLWVVAGLASLAFPAATASFGIGAVPMLLATATYGAALASLWFTLTQPTPARVVGLGIAAFGLLFLHIAEAFALGLVAVLGVLTVGRATLARLGPARLAALGVLVLGAMAVAFLYLPDLLVGWDIEANDKSVAQGLLAMFVLVPGTSPTLAIVWLPVTLAGIWLAVRRGLGLFPLVALAVPMVLGILASVSLVPGWLTILTAPWFGAVGRIHLLAVAPICLFASLALVRALGDDRWVGAGGGARSGARPIAFALLVAAAALIGGTAVPTVASHRSDLAATLAGAGDTPDIARALGDLLVEGQTVLNFEGDGTANLFAASRVPVIAGSSEPSSDTLLGRDYAIARDGLMSIAHPTVSAALERLKVGYVAIGTTSMYWDSPYFEPVGYDLPTLLRQPELTVALTGSDMVVLRYQAGSTQ